MNVVWKNQVDNKYDVSVESGEDAYKGFLVIRAGEKELHREAVCIGYGARFGPDINDVFVWENRCLEVIDNLPKT